MIKSIKFLIISLLTIFLCFNCYAFSTLPQDYASSYSLSIVNFDSYPVQTFKYTLQLEESGLYTLLEKRIVGNHSYEYPILYGVWYINPDNETLVLNVNGLEIPFSWDDGVIVANSNTLGGLAVIAYSKNKLCTFNLMGMCQYDIIGDDKANVGEIKTYYVTTSSQNCYYNIDVDNNATIQEIKYSDTGDAIVTVKFNDSGDTKIIVNNTVFDVNVIENNQE